MNARKRPLRVIQWATGVVGRHAIAAITAHPELELVGARVYSEEKAGRDVGEFCGLGPTGVIATTSSDEVLAMEADCVFYAAQGEMYIMGFGRAPDAAVPLGNPELMGATFRAPIEDFAYTREVAVTDHTFRVAAGEIREGTVAAQRFGYSGIIAGRRAITVEHITRVGADQAPHWPTGRGWRIRIEGEPSMVMEATIAVNGEDENDQGCLGTAMHAIHAIQHVCAAAPGIRTFLDLPIITGRGAIDSWPGLLG